MGPQNSAREAARIQGSTEHGGQQQGLGSYLPMLSILCCLPFLSALLKGRQGN